MIKVKGQVFKKGQRIRVKGIVDPGPKVQDADLNGRTGVLVSKHPDIFDGEIGAYLDKLPHENNLVKCNLKLGEFELI